MKYEVIVLIYGTLKGDCIEWSKSLFEKCPEVLHSYNKFIVYRFFIALDRARVHKCWM